MSQNTQPLRPPSPSSLCGTSAMQVCSPPLSPSWPDLHPDASGRPHDHADLRHHAGCCGAGSRLSAIASLVYLALALWGVPVLANFSGGFDKFVGPTGGFLISFPLMAYIIGLGVEHRDASRVLSSPLSSSAR